MTVVAVTGASGYLGRRLLDALDERKDVRRVIAVDLREPAATRNLEYYRMDVRSPTLSEALVGADVLYHLAFRLPPQRDVGEMGDVNVGGTRNVLAAAAGAGVRKVVHLSSVMAYGAHPDNDVPLSEDAPLRPVRDFPYSAHKGECEELLAAFKEAHPETVVTVFRPALVMGPTVTGVVAQVVESPVVLRVRGHDVPLQAVHEADVARALVFALDHDLDGAWNLAPGDWIGAERVAELTGRRVVELSEDEARSRLERMSSVGLSALEPSYLPFLLHPWVMSSDKLQGAGFRFLHDTEGALIAAAEARRGWVSVGRVRFRPKRVAAVAAGVAAVVAGSALRRARRAAGI